MKTRLFEYLEAARHRREIREHRQWQRIRRMGQGGFIALFIVGFWLFAVAAFYYAAWRILPSMKVLHRLPAHFYRQLVGYVAMQSIILYFGARYIWRKNGRKYQDDRNP